MKCPKLLGLAVAALALAGCVEDEELVSPVESTTQTRLFERYVALGNSITAGFQSSGISPTTQANAYPVLVAAQAAKAFEYPVRFEYAKLAAPGCTPPLRGPFLVDTARVAGTSATCALLANPTPRINQNLAIPGARILDLINNFRTPTSSNVLTSLFLGGRTQTQALVEAQPTLVSAFIGNNDVLGGAGAGDTTRLTSAPAFQAALDTLVAAIKQTPAASPSPNTGVVLLGIAPFPAILQPGAYLFALAQDPTFTARSGKTVNANCAPFNALGQRNPLSSNLVSLAIFNQPAVTQISCADNAPFLLNAAEQQALFNRIDAYNNAIRTVAQQNDWIFINTNELLGGTGATPANLRTRLDPQRFRLCQAVAQATPTNFQLAVATTCPGPTLGAGGTIPPYTPGSAAYANFFGSFLTFDAVHPSPELQRVLANGIILALNAKFSTNIPLVGT